MADLFDEGNLLIDPSEAATNDDIEIVDDLYTKERVYKKGIGTDGFEGWHRYKHPKSVNTGYTMSSATNPYEFIGLTGGNPVMYKESVGNDLNPAFAHGYLESERITDGIVPGDMYELKMNVKPEQGLPIHFLDLNIATGGTVEDVREIPPHDLPGTLINAREYKKRHAESIYSTFNKPAKYVSNFEYDDNLIEIQEFFTMPARPAAYEGFNIQIGPAISDNEFSLEPTFEPDTQVPNICATYFNVNYPLNGSMPLFPTSPMPNNFGIGLPSHGLLNIWDNYGYGDLNYCGTGNQYSPARYWWNNLPTNAWPNEPTGTQTTRRNEGGGPGEEINSRLQQVELFRITKNPWVLKRVTKKRWKYPNVDINQLLGDGYDDIASNFVLVSALELDYSLIQDERYMTMIAGFDSGNGKYSEAIGKRNIILLDRIQQLPLDYATGNYNGDYTKYPAHLFSYSKFANNFEDVFSDVTFLGSNIGTERVKQNFLLMDQVINPLGGVTNIEYQIPENGYLGGPTGYVKSYYHQEYPRGKTTNSYDPQFNNLFDINSARERAWLVKEISNITDSRNTIETFDFADLEVNFDGPFYDWSNESFRRFNTSTGFKKATKFIKHTDASGIRNFREETEFYTGEEDAHFFGKVKNHKVFDDRNNLVSHTASTYEAVLAYEALHRRKHFRAAETFYADYKNYYLDDDGNSVFRPLMEDYPGDFNAYRDAVRSWDSNFFYSPDGDNGSADGFCCGDQIHADPNCNLPYNDNDHPTSAWRCREPSFIYKLDDWQPAITEECFREYVRFGMGDPRWECTVGDNTTVDGYHPYFLKWDEYSREHAVWQSEKPDNGSSFSVPNPVMIADQGHIGAGHEYYELLAGNKIDDLDPTYLNAYFIKKVKEEQWSYENECESGDGTRGVVPAHTISEYEYFDANYAGYSRFSGL